MSDCHLCARAGAVAGITFTFTNRCGGTVWPGVLANSGSSPLQTTGFALGAGEARSLAAPAGWSGRFWARTGCAFDASGKGSCATGDCGSGEVECRGRGAAPPATLAEFTLGGSGGKDYYDVSLVDGYNLPVSVSAVLGTGAADPSRCAIAGCARDVNAACPPELQVTAGGGKAAAVVACKSACLAFGLDAFCCRGAYATPAACRGSVYSRLFKDACPAYYSYAYDTTAATASGCRAREYVITFCPGKWGGELDGAAAAQI